MIITDAYFYLTAIPAVLIYGIGKGGLGGALGVVAVPLMALTVSPTQAAAILLPLLCIMDVFAIKLYYKSCDWVYIKRLIPGALLGIFFAYCYLKEIPEYGLKILIGSISLLFCLQYAIKIILNSNKPEKKPGSISAFIWGMLSGFSSTAIHAGGGPLNVYLLPQKLDKITLIATTSIFFGIVNVAKLIPYTLLGEFSKENLITALILMPLAPIGVKIGAWLLHRIKQSLVYQLCYLFLFISGIKLLFDGTIALLHH